MTPDNRKKHVKSLENLPEDILAIFNEKYPKGFQDYLPDLTKYTPGINPRTGLPIEPFYAVTIETPEDIYLVKVKVKIDDAEDIERWLEGEEEAENEEVAGASGTPDTGDGTLPDDNISQYGSDDPSEM